MSKWLILVLVVVGAFFAVRHLLNSPQGYIKGPSNKDELARSLDALIDFLSKQEQFRWAETLREIQTYLQNPATEVEGLSRLSGLFGGMGSLNDLVFDGAGVDEVGAHLLDAVFRDMKLYHGTPEHRAQWKKLEEEHKDEPPPRIKHAFRKE